MTKWTTKNKKIPKTLTKWIKEELKKAEDENKKENLSPQTYSKCSFLSLFIYSCIVSVIMQNRKSAVGFLIERYRLRQCDEPKLFK